MKNIFVYLTVGIMILTSSYVLGENLFYYGNEEKIPFSIVHNKRALLRQAAQNRDDYIERIGARIQIIPVVANWNENPKSMYETADGTISLPVINIDNEIEAVLLPEIVLKPQKYSYDMSSLCDKYHLTLKEDLKRHQVYSVPITGDVISIANALYEMGLFDFVHPNFFCSTEQTAYFPNDIYFPYQIACHNTGQTLPNGHSGTANADINAPEAWEITKGSSNIVVAVIDQGVTSNHPDLPNSRQVRLNGSNFGTGNPNDPSPTGNDNHGNACAGVIAATMDNNEGIAGIAPNCKILPIRKDTTSSLNDIANAFYFAMNNGARIISNSWTYGYQNPNFYPALKAAIDTVINHNIVVVFSAGNTANHVGNINGVVNFPANYFGDGVITVGASDRYDCMANYSPISSFIDFVAPSHRAYSSRIAGETLEMWTLDIPGNAGYNPIPTIFSDTLYAAGTTIPNSGTNNLAYTGCFGGTSHSCPVVAGVVALMLSVNPNLTPTHVFEILKETSAKVGPYTYTNGKCNQMGYGRVDAYAAVVAASSNSIQGPDYICHSDTIKCYLAQASTFNSLVTWSLSNASNFLWNFSIIGNTHLDTVLVKATYSDPLMMSHNGQGYSSDMLSPREILPTLSVTITTGSTSKTYSKKFRMPIGQTPSFTASSSATWYTGTPRTFTVTNCTNEPDSVFSWIAKRGATIAGTGTGKSFTFIPVMIGTYNISVTNNEKECGNATTTHPYSVYRKTRIDATSDNNILNIILSEEDEDAQRSPAQLNENSDYTIELWHSIFGRMKEQTFHSSTIRIDTSSLPLGVYVVVLKENGEVIAQTKVRI